MGKPGRKHHAERTQTATKTPTIEKWIAYLVRHPAAISVGLAALATLRIVATYAVFNHTIDEPAHIACGMEWLDRHTFRIETHHPPLARVAVALGPYLAGARSPNEPDFYKDNPFHIGALILYTGSHYYLYLTLARIATLPFFWIATLAAYRWSKARFGPLQAVLSVFLFTFLPPVLAHAGVATNDMALTGFVAASFVVMREWVDRPVAARSMLLGLCVACATLSKLTALAFIPATFAAALAWYMAVQRPRFRELAAQARRLALPFGLAVATGALTMWAMYRFSFGPVAGSPFRVPAPEFFDGIRGLAEYNTRGYPAYLLGKHSAHGWWYFYAVVLSVKTPIAFLLLLAAGAVATWRQRPRTFDVLLPLVFSVALLLVPFFMHVNNGLRYLLPVYVGFSITAAAGAVELLKAGRQRWLVTGSLVLGAWMALTSLAAHPDYIPYVNLFAGDHPENILADSDLDWGQDVNRMGKRLQELGVKQVAFSPFILADLRLHGWPTVTDSDPQTPAPGWNALSITVWKVARMGLMNEYPDAVLWPDTAKPVERVGKGMLLYYFPPAAFPQNATAPHP